MEINIEIWTAQDAKHYKFRHSFTTYLHNAFCPFDKMCIRHDSYCSRFCVSAVGNELPSASFRKQRKSLSFTKEQKIQTCIRPFLVLSNVLSKLYMDHFEISNSAPQIKLNEPGHEKTCRMSYANNKGADKPTHLRSLISAFVVRCLDNIISLGSRSEISRF